MERNNRFQGHGAGGQGGFAARGFHPGFGARNQQGGRGRFCGRGRFGAGRFGGGRHAQGQGGRWYDNGGSRAGDGAQGGNRFDHHWNIGFGSHAGPNGGNLNPSLAVPAFFGGGPAGPPLFGAGSAGVPAAVPPGPGAGGRGVVFPASVPAGGTFFQEGGVGAALGSAPAAGNFVPASGGLPVSVGLAVGGAGAASFAAPIVLVLSMCRHVEELVRWVVLQVLLLVLLWLLRLQELVWLDRPQFCFLLCQVRLTTVIRILFVLVVHWHHQGWLLQWSPKIVLNRA